MDKNLTAEQAAFCGWLAEWVDSLRDWEKLAVAAIGLNIALERTAPPISGERSVVFSCLETPDPDGVTKSVSITAYNVPAECSLPYLGLKIFESTASGVYDSVPDGPTS